MKRSLVKMSLISCCALMCAHAFAQSAGKPTAVDASKTKTAAVSVRVVKPPVALATITAAGSVIVLADGIVANAAIAPIQPPPDGFVYER